MHDDLQPFSQSLQFLHLSASITGRNIAKRESSPRAVPTGQIELQYSRPFHQARTLNTTKVTAATMSVGRLLSQTSRV